MAESETVTRKHQVTIAEAVAEASRLLGEGDCAGAAALYRKILARHPEKYQVWGNLGVALRRDGRRAQAVAVQRRAAELAPNDDSVANNLANALADFGAFDEAFTIRRARYEAAPTDPKLVADYAMMLRYTWRHREAIEVIDRAEAAIGREALGAATLQRALARLMLGEYAPGFADFEARFLSDEVSLPEAAPWPRWEGGSVAGKRVAVLREQGLGDAIVYARFLPRLKAMGAHVTLSIQKPLARLMGRIEGVDAGAVPGLSPDAEIDLYTTNASLPHLVGMPEDGPPPPPRLTIPEDSRARARHILEPFDGRFKIGIVWTGAADYRGNHRRSTEIAHFAGLAALPGVQLVSLAKGDAATELAKSGYAGLILNAASSDRDLADAAGLIDEMDLMITTDTSVVHVAGSLGKPIWNLLAYEGYWLYGTGETTPWYPSMRLFRQERSGDWTGLFARVKDELATLLEARA